MDVSSAIARLAAKDPSRPAVIDETACLTYGELHERADRWAFAFRKLGIAKGGELLLLLPNRAEFVELLIAAIRAETVPLVVNTAFTSRDLAALGSVARANAMIVSRELAAGLSLDLLPNLRVYYIEDFDLSSVPAGGGSPSGRETDLVFFTSGTTGKPKGTVVPSAVFHSFGPPADPRRAPMLHLLCRPLFFRAHTTALFQILQEGNAVVLARRADPSLWLKLIERHRIRFVSLGPSDLGGLLDALESSGETMPASVKHIMSTGAPLSQALKRKIRKLLPDVRVTDLYGTSEVGAIAMIGSDEWESKAGSCGKPIFFADVKIMDEYKREAPVGNAGEIWVKSRYRMREYYRDPSATAWVCGGEFVRTGDVGYFDEQGYLYITGRNDRVINCGGYQLHPEEVEDALRERPEVKEAVVVGRAHQERAQQPVAFVSLRDRARSRQETEEETAFALMNHCRSRLAGYKVPAAVFIVPDIPMNAAGKADIAELTKRAAERYEYTLG